jgi:hypothetical protein
LLVSPANVNVGCWLEADVVELELVPLLLPDMEGRSNAHGTATCLPPVADAPELELPGEVELP